MWPRRAESVLRKNWRAPRRWAWRTHARAISAASAGVFGWEEARAIAPAIADARQEGIDATGPVPPDTVFVKAASGQYDMAVAMYHDQGHIPVKLLGFHMDEATGAFSAVGGVNITVGLPIIRTSVDHGTAFDQAGKNRANPQSMIDAIRMAARMAGG